MPARAARVSVFALLSYVFRRARARARDATAHTPSRNIHSAVARVSFSVSSLCDTEYVRLPRETHPLAPPSPNPSLRRFASRSSDVLLSVRRVERAMAAQFANIAKTDRLFPPPSIY